VRDVFSSWSMLIFVERIEVPLRLMSTTGAPEDEAVPSEARTRDTSIANGIRKVSFAVPVVIAVVSSPTVR
jgi:hypothetical protein